MTRFVLDASVTLSWLIDRPAAPYAIQVRKLLLQGGLATVPAIWQWEVANGFVTAERRGILTPTDTAALLDNLDVVLRSIEVSYKSASIRQAVGNSRQFGLTAYDFAYLDLAKELQLPIATLDHALSRAAMKADVEILK